MLVDLPARAEAQHCAAVADVVDGHSALGEHHRMVDGDRRDHRRQAQVGYSDGDRG